MRTIFTCAVLFAQACLLLAAGAPADEIDALVEKVKPPARFGDRQALFTLKKEPFRSVRYPWRSMQPRVSTNDAHSGKMSIAVKGVPELRDKPSNGNRSWYRLSLSRRYRTECWIKVVGEETEAFVANHRKITPGEPRHK
jgi:hypothetical protein